MVDDIIESAHLKNIKEKKMLTDEEKQIMEVIIAARKLEEYLWGEYNGQWNIEEWRRMFRKRIQKIDDM